MVKNGKRCKKCGKMFCRKSNLKPHNVNIMSKALKTKSINMSVECCNCDIKSGIANKLRGHLLMKHSKLNLVTIVPDRGKLDSHRLQVTNGKITSIQVKMANCHKCSHTSVFRSDFGLHIQAGHSIELFFSSLYSTEKDEETATKIADKWTKLLVSPVRSSRTVPPFSTLLILRTTTPASSMLHMLTKTKRRISNLLLLKLFCRSLGLPLYDKLVSLWQSPRPPSR